ncbi:MAG: DUF6445 family protein [Betaproteobacteria bacterium]
MNQWLDSAGRLFHPQPRISIVPLGQGRPCVVVDDVLANPDGVVAWASEQAFQPPQGYPYPGVVLPLPDELTQRVSELFAVHARARLGGRRTTSATVRLAMVTTPAQQLDPLQWQCHRDRISDDPDAVLYAASVMYLFRDATLGGTSFYVPRQPADKITRVIVDSQQLNAKAFAERHGVRPGYMDGSNAYFERIAQVPAAWNRMIFYDGGMFHSGDVGRAEALVADPRTGRLTMNGFFSCKPAAR